MRRLTRPFGPIAVRFCASASAAGKGTVAIDMPQSDKKLEEFATLYSQLTLKEVTTLQKLIFKKLGHSEDFYEQALLRGLGGGGGGGGGVAVQAQAVAAPAADDGDAEAAKLAEEAAKKKAVAKTAFDVKLGSYPPANKIKLIKELRAVTGLPLKEAKDAIEKAPGVIVSALNKDDAEKLKKLLVEHGSEVELV
jgi:large subunit ribosomal protein L7/L12